MEKETIKLTANAIEQYLKKVKSERQAAIDKARQENLPVPPAKERYVWFEKNRRLCIRIHPGGNAAYYVIMKAIPKEHDDDAIGEATRKSKLQRIRLGAVDDLTVAAAETEALRTIAKLSSGKDLQQHQRVQKEQGRTLQECFEDSIRNRKIKQSTKTQYAKLMNRCFSDWLDKPLRSITSEMVRTRHNEMSSKSLRYVDHDERKSAVKHSDWTGKGQADYAMRVLRLVFNHAMHTMKDSRNVPIIDHNPVKALSTGNEWNNLAGRKEYIEDDELRAWHQAVMNLVPLEENSQNVTRATIRDVLIFSLFTGLRKEEVLKLSWKEVNLDRGEITLPPSRTKNGQEHRFPVSTQVLQLLKRRHDEMRMAAVSSVLVFPIVECRKAMAQVTKETGKEFTHHTLRHTFTTKANALGDIGAYTIKHLVNHTISKSDVTANYAQKDMKAMKIATQKVADAFDAIISPKESLSIAEPG